MSFPEQQIQQALRLAETGNLRDAVGILRTTVTQAPGLALPRFLLAMLLHQSGASPVALDEIGHALALEPGNIAMQELRAMILVEVGPAQEAQDYARSLIAGGVDRSQVWLCLGTSLQQLGRLEESAAAFRSALVARPDFSRARLLLVRTLIRQALHDEALEAASAGGLPADSAAVQGAIDDFVSAGAVDQAIALLNHPARRGGTNYETSIRVARLLHQRGRSSEALAWSERAHALQPDALEPQEMRAVGLIDRGDAEAGLALYRALLRRADIGPESANRFLILSHYDPAEDHASLFRAHVNWVQRFAQPFGEPFDYKPDRDPQRRLRIGWISPRFSAGPVASFLRDTFAAWDKTDFHHTLVSLAGTADTATAQFRELSDDWLEVRDLDDTILLNRLRAQRFDIVVDLAGHSFGNRLRVLAQRVAPIQLCWLDYFNTTGATAIDYWISDAWLTPEDSPQRYVESLRRLNSGRFCYSPPSEAPAPDYIGDDVPVFGSFNRLAKLNDQVLDAWAAILQRVPAAQLELGAGLLSDPVVRARTIERFTQRGIAAERLRLHGSRSYTDLLDAYRRIDIALDPFPFSGCTTTADALWMGAPVVTLPGTTFVSRQSASLLQRMQRDEWVADTVDDYIACAVDMAERVLQLRGARAQLREDVRRALCDGAAQALEMGGMFRGLWQEYVAERK